MARVNIANIIKQKKGSALTMRTIIVLGVNGMQKWLLSSLLSLLVLLMLVVAVVERGQCVFAFGCVVLFVDLSVLLMPLYRRLF